MQPFIFGDLGVDIFFVLSGFLIASILLKEHAKTEQAHALAVADAAEQTRTPAVADAAPAAPPQRPCLTINVRRFFISRWLRLTPAYFFAMLVFMLVPQQRDACLKWGWTNLLFINNLVGPDLTHQACMIHTWSIAIEGQFYLVSPLIILLMAALHRAGRTRAAYAVPTLLGAASLAARGAWVLWAVQHAQHEHVTDWSLRSIYDKVWTRCAPYLAGTAVAYAHHVAPADKPASAVSRRQRCARLVCNVLATATWLGVAYFGPGLCTSRILSGEVHKTRYEYGVAYMLLLWLGRAAFGCAVAYVVSLSLTPGRGGWLTAVLRWRVWTPIATLSYSAYLLQYLSMLTLVRLVPVPAHPASVYVTFALFVAMLLGVYVGVFAVALLCYMVVEKPVMNLR